MRKHNKIKRIAALGLATMIFGMGMTVLANDEPQKAFNFDIAKIETPYDGIYSYKAQSYPYSSVYVDDYSNYMFQWGTVRITGFTVANMDGTQISTNIQVPAKQTHVMGYYNSNYSGNVALIANATATGAGYSVKGTWKPSLLHN